VLLAPSLLLMDSIKFRELNLPWVSNE
jgi:hypothetical protein